MNEHTPTPYKVETDADVSGACIYSGSNYVGHIEHRRDADFIVRACNAHQELLEACKNAIISLSITQVQRLDNNVATHEEIIDVVKKSLEEVVAKAEKGA